MVPPTVVTELALKTADAAEAIPAAAAFSRSLTSSHVNFEVRRHARWLVVKPCDCLLHERYAEQIFAWLMRSADGHALVDAFAGLEWGSKRSAVAIEYSNLSSAGVEPMVGKVDWVR